jgi:REP element-mobilizing transposase RayT
MFHVNPSNTSSTKYFACSTDDISTETIKKNISKNKDDSRLSGVIHDFQRCILSY